MFEMKKLEKLIVALEERKLTIATAESCSGGYACYLLTKIPGSSKIFKGGVVVYSLETKNKFFNIPYPLLKKTQGVSEEIALILAKKVRKKFAADIGSSIVGFAGPKAKRGVEAGTVFVGIADKQGAITKKVIIKGNRDMVRKKASYLLINLIYKRLQAV